MKTLLFGDKRYIKEVLYVCEDIFSGGYEIFFLDEVDKLLEFYDRENSEILLCVYDLEAAEEKLQNVGLDKKDYRLVESVFYKMDRAYLRIPSDRPVAVWGLSEQTKAVGNMLSKYADLFIDVDPKKQADLFFGKKVVSPENALTSGTDYFYLVMLNNNGAKEAEEVLNRYGKKEGVDWCLNKLVDTFFPSEMLYQTIHDNPLEGISCFTAMEKIDFGPNGQMWPCCAYFLPMSIGDMRGADVTVHEIWNSYKARIIKLSMINHTYTFCRLKDSDLCPVLFAEKDKYVYAGVSYDGADYSNTGAENIPRPSLNIDCSCNLRCETCRQDYYHSDGQTLEWALVLADKIAKEVMPYAEMPIISGNGDIFSSKVYRRIWINESGKKRPMLSILTNGILFNEENWALLEKGYEKIILAVSIDAATKETYESVRRGGKWEILVKNMEFAGRLRKENKLVSFSLNFVVQQKNYLECKEFVKLGKLWNCDSIRFTRVRNWGTYTQEEFVDKISLFYEEKEDRIKDEYRDYFKDEIFDSKYPLVRDIEVFR